jgi:transposase-like protein
MLNLSDLSRLKGFRFPCSVIGYSVWVYHRFGLSLRGFKDLLASRGNTVSYETIAIIRRAPRLCGLDCAFRFVCRFPVPGEQFVQA